MFVELFYTDMCLWQLSRLWKFVGLRKSFPFQYISVLSLYVIDNVKALTWFSKTLIAYSVRIRLFVVHTAREKCTLLGRNAQTSKWTGAWEGTAKDFSFLYLSRRGKRTVPSCLQKRELIKQQFCDSPLYSSTCQVWAFCITPPCVDPLTWNCKDSEMVNSQLLASQMEYLRLQQSKRFKIQNFLEREVFSKFLFFPFLSFPFLFSFLFLSLSSSPPSFLLYFSLSFFLVIVWFL